MLRNSFMLCINKNNCDYSSSFSCRWSRRRSILCRFITCYINQQKMQHSIKEVYWRGKKDRANGHVHHPPRVYNLWSLSRTQQGNHDYFQYLLFSRRTKEWTLSILNKHPFDTLLSNIYCILDLYRRKTILFNSHETRWKHSSDKE